MNDLELLTRYVVAQQTLRARADQHVPRPVRGTQVRGIRRSARLIAQQIRASRRHAGNAD